MGRVTFGRVPEECLGAKESHVPLSRFLPILEAYAEIWDVEIFADWPVFLPKPPENDGRVITVNFFHEYVLPVTPAEKYNNLHKVFHFDFGTPVQRLASSLPWGQPCGGFHDFDGTLLCHVEKKSMFIDFEFLRNCWDGHETVLQILLAWGLSKMVTRTGRLEDLMQGERFSKYIEKQCAADEESTVEKYIEHQNKLMQKAVIEYRSGLEATLRSSVGTEANYASLFRAHEELEAFDRQIKASISRIDLEKDFERLRALDGVKNVRVEGGRIIVVTHPLVQMYPPPSMVENHPTAPYDVGSIEFTINTEMETHGGIEFRPVVFGSYRNAFFGPNICFGQGGDGLNTVLSKLLITYKIPDIAALILTFFRFVHAAPAVFGDGDRMAMNHMKATDSFDDSAENWNLQKQAYIALGVERLSMRSQAGRQAELTALKVRIETEFASLKKSWDSASELKRLINYLMLSSDTMPLRVESTLQELKKNQTFLGIDMHGGFRIWFYQPHVFRYPSVLWVDVHGVIRLISFYNDYGQVGHSLISDLDSHNLDCEKLFEHAAQGEYDKVLNDVLLITHGWKVQGRPR